MYDNESLLVLSEYCRGLGTIIMDCFAIKNDLGLILSKLNSNAVLNAEERMVLITIREDMIPKKLELAIDIILGGFVSWI